MDQRLREIIDILSSTKDYVPGTVIARRLGLSRAMVHRLVEELKLLGYIIETHPRRGYRLLVSDDLSLADRYVRDIPGPLKFRVHYVEKCASTQDIAEALARQGVPEGTIVLAEEMSKGRGRMGREWIASKGGLWFTIILRPRKIRYLQLLSLVAGASIVEGIEGFLGVKTMLKWPNDVLYNDLKLAGILVEGRVEADIVDYILLGIGLNVNNNLPSWLKDKATTLANITGRKLPRIPLLRSILYRFNENYKALVEEQYDRITSLWRKYSTTIGSRVRVHLIDGRTIEGLAEDIADDGSLVVKLTNGTRILVYAGDVEHLR